MELANKHKIEFLQSLGNLLFKYDVEITSCENGINIHFNQYMSVDNILRHEININVHKIDRFINEKECKTSDNE